MPARVVSARDGARPSVVLHLISARIAEGPPHSALSDFPTPPPTWQQNSYRAWSNHPPVPTDQKVGGSNPFGRAQLRGPFRHSGSASACTLTALLPTVSRFERCSVLRREYQIECVGPGYSRITELVTPGVPPRHFPESMVAASMSVSAADRACSRGEVSLSDVASARAPSKSTASWLPSR